MRLLPDENVPIRLRLYFPEKCHAETVDYRSWKRLGNGQPGP
jgi:predicted nuclease of predicted toxin-antitoxin system